MLVYLTVGEPLHFSSEFVDDSIAVPEGGFQSLHGFALGLILEDPEVDDIIALGMLAHGYPLVRSDHICARVGTVGRILRFRCSEASCRGVSPAHTPCMSPEGNDSA